MNAPAPQHRKESKTPGVFPFLNWKELERFCSWVSPRIEGAFIEKIIVPDRPQFPLGFLKGEWALRIEGRKEQHTLFCSVRAQKPSLHYSAGKGPKAAPEATRSPFDLALSKQIRGARILKLEAIAKERIALLWLTVEGRAAETERAVLVFKLIPAQPEALLLQVRGPFPARGIAQGPYVILARSRTVRGEGADRYTFPASDRAPPDLPIREELIADLRVHEARIEEALRQEAWESRIAEAQKLFREKFKHAQERARQSAKSEEEAGLESDWQYFGDLLKALLHSPPPVEWIGKPGAQGSKPFRRVEDWNTGAELPIPCDPKITDARAQVDKYYQLARRKQRRLEEAHSRLRSFEEQGARLLAFLDHPPAPGDWKALEEYERHAGILRKLIRADAAAGAKPGGKSAFSARSWSGKTFVSRDGYPIWVGRTKDENLELTFKHARGNDLWMHVKGKPGAHVVVPIPSGKSASLETLLDAAQLTLFYSGGQSWGKTEIDYTFKKHVKRIRDSSEASYTQNKTLVVQAETDRLKRLLEQNP